MLIEHDQGVIKPVSFEILSAARKLADEMSGKVIAFYFSNVASLEAEVLFKHGADEVRFLHILILKIMSTKIMLLL